MKSVVWLFSVCIIMFFHCALAKSNNYWWQGNTHSNYYKPHSDTYNQKVDYDTAYNLYRLGKLDESLPIFAKLCELNNYIACLSAGIVQGRILENIDSDRRFSRSERKRKKIEYYNNMMSFYTKACNGGNYDACNNLAFYEHVSKEEREKEKKRDEEHKIEKDRTIELYAKSCKAGNKEACQNLGLIYSGDIDDKNNTSYNLTQAQNYYGRSCSMGDSVACFNLGVLRYNYAKSAGDYAQAIHYFNQSCGDDYPDACLNLGIIYERGVTQDMNEDIANAMQYYTKACYLRNDSACTYLSKLANKRKKIK